MASILHRTSGGTWPTADLIVNVTNTRQTMDGFGAADPFLDVTPFSDAQADQLFDPTAGIGLSILRTGMWTDGTTMSFYSNLTKAAARGARILAYPFSADATQKDNGDVNNGGHLLSGSYDAWATTIAGYQATVQSNAGVNLYAISVQNEPDHSATYASMLYTTTEMVNFVKVLGPKIAALSPRPILLLPDTANWDNSQSYASAVLADSTAAQYLDACSAHQYGGTPATVGSGKSTWMTEMSYFSAFDSTMTNALLMASDIHSALTTGGASAWIWWWALRTSQTDNEGLTDTTQTTKRLWVMGNWSKFVRPGMVRISTSGSISGISMTAFRNTSTGAFAVVCINANGTPNTFNVGLVGARPTTVTPWRTSSSEDLLQLSPYGCYPNGVFPATLPANSVTTFVGTAAA